jgi:hypothetical protein
MLRENENKALTKRRTKMERMLETLEEARKESENPCPFAIYAYGNGKEITYHRSFNDSALRPFLMQQGYWLVSIFQNGHRVEA